jgi:hypothetical protein
VKDLTKTIGSLQQVVAVNQTTNDDRSVQQAVGLNPESLLHILTQLPWGHHVLIISEVKDPSEAFFYLRQTIEYKMIFSAYPQCLPVFPFLIDDFLQTELAEPLPF